MSRPARHGHAVTNAVTPEYMAWTNMLARCAGKTESSRRHYVSRGITVCAEWRDSFEAFLAHIGPRPSPAHSVDRIDNDRGYEPGNVRWATRKEQARNTSFTRLVEIDGARASVAEWAERKGISLGSIYRRMKKHGWSIERAILTPPDAKRTPKKWRKDSENGRR